MIFSDILPGLFIFLLSAFAQAAGLFISFARTKETKQRRVVEDSVRKKFAVCTFLPTPVGDSTKEKELAALKQLFLLYGKERKFLHASPLKAGILLRLGGFNFTSLV